MNETLALLAVYISIAAAASCVGVVGNQRIQGMGTIVDPYTICTVQQYNVIGGSAPNGKYWMLGADLNFTGIALNPISNFNGNFNGNGHRVFNYRLQRGLRADLATKYVGLFNSVNNSVIHDINIVLTLVQSGQVYVGGLVGQALNSTFYNINAKLTVQSFDDYTGGLFGYVSQCNISNVVILAPAVQLNYGVDAVGMLIGVGYYNTINNILIDGSATYTAAGSTMRTLSAVGALAGWLRNSTVSNTNIIFSFYFPSIIDSTKLPNGVGNIAGWTAFNTYNNIRVVGAIYFNNVAITELYGNYPFAYGLLLGYPPVYDTVVNCVSIVL